MKKYNEGYTLPFVMAVLAVMCIVASSVLSVGLRNLQSQKNAINRMQDKYVAEGALEIVVAKLEDLGTYSDGKWDVESSATEPPATTAPTNGTTDDPEEESQLRKEVKEFIAAKVKGVDPFNVIGEMSWTDTIDEERFDCQFPVDVKQESTKISCVLNLKIMIGKTTIDGKECWKVTSANISYQSFEIGGAA